MPRKLERLEKLEVIVTPVDRPFYFIERRQGIYTVMRDGQPERVITRQDLDALRDEGHFIVLVNFDEEREDRPAPGA